MSISFVSLSAIDEMHNTHRDCEEPHDRYKKDRLQRWISKAKTGDHEALGKLIDACHELLLPVARRCIPLSLKSKFDPADLIQEAALEAHRSIAGLKGETIEEFFSWLRRILIHKSGGIRRRFEDTDKRNIDLEFAEFSDGVEGLARTVQRPTPSEMAIDLEQRAQLLESVNRLPEDMKQAIALRHRDGLTFSNIGEQMNRSGEAARKLWERAVRRLRKDIRGFRKSKE
jgi:RNA polymerase sigma-70 factor (ECF subfamily)